MQPRVTVVPLILAAMLALCPRLYAPIHGGFPGLRELIEKSDAIIVAIISEELSDADFGGSAHYKVWRERTLKGNLDPERLTLRMRQLEITTPALESSDGVWLGDATPLSFAVDSRYVLFLSRTEGDEKVQYENVNCDGSSFQVSRWLRLETLDRKSLTEALSILLVDYRDFARARLKHIEQRTEMYLDGR